MDPPRVQRGEETELLVTYEVSGVPPGGAWEVVELREILKGDRSLTTLEDRYQRGSGSYSTTHRIRIPGDLAPGVYRLEATIRLLGLEDGKTAIFEVY